ncbi:NADP-dependent oxidoreductase [Pseudovibrio sp. WM33]|uniref:NADP-dependent oxidoreductase n=1 Tax=Pseudovibrio sp. WM33 TaxID=1735585 RepID=UPI0007AE50F8|nr:NADP-dependent oxidoreductase [Pseudovibrio sp. WM33]KZL24692.1 putative NADP-dependent oxidoreductase YfmJ [Pseudovibrio sp. WM33]
MAINQQLCLQRRPSGEVCKEDFFLRETDIPDLEDGQFLVRNEYISIDPAMRGWIQDQESYFPPVQLGEPMRGLTVGRIEASRHPSYSVGDLATGMLNMQTYAISDGFQIRKVDPDIAPPPAWLGGLGMPGITAYFGLLDIGRPMKGDTVVVSAASGAVGSIVGQIAKNLGCRVIGIVGSDKKSKYIVEELGFDAAINYKSEPIGLALSDLCPEKIDVYFDNVAGKALDSILPFMKKFGRIPLCGMISIKPGEPARLDNFFALISNSIRLQGFVMSDYVPKIKMAVDELKAWHQSGQLIFKEDVRTTHLENFPEVINDLFSGKNEGKLVMKLSND